MLKIVFAVLTAMTLMTLLVWGFILVPVITASVCALVVPAMIAWRFVCEKNKVPWFFWGQTEESGVTFEKILIFGIWEFRNIPAKHAWIVRDATHPNPDEGKANSGYHDYRAGWHYIIFPQWKWFTQSMVNMKPLNLDVKPIVVNTKGLPVHLDGRVTYQVVQPVLYAVRFQEDLATVTEQLLSVTANVETQGNTDQQLYEDLDKAGLIALSKAITTTINGPEDGNLGSYGVKVAYGIQAIRPDKAILDAQALARESEYETTVAKERARAIKATLKASRVPDSPYNLILPLMAQFVSMFSGSRAGTDLTIPTITIGGGGINSGKPKSDKPPTT